MSEKELETRVSELEKKLADERSMSHRAWISLNAKLHGLEQEWKDYEDAYRSLVTFRDKLRFRVTNLFRRIMRKDVLSPEERTHNRMARIFYRPRG